MPPKKANKGRLKRNGVRLEPHEEKTVRFLLAQGNNVELIPPSNIPNSNNPDIMMNGTYWEMKCCFSMNKSTIKTKFKKAVKQSSGKAIFDIREIKGDKEDAKNFMKGLFKSIRGMRRLIIIDTDKTIDVKK